MTENQSPNELAPLTLCGGRMEDPDLYPSDTYNGKKVYFCHTGCLHLFKRSPQAFLAGELEHPDPDAP